MSKSNNHGQEETPVATDTRNHPGVMAAFMEGFGCAALYEGNCDPKFWVDFWPHSQAHADWVEAAASPSVSREAGDDDIVRAVTDNFRKDLDRIMAENPPPETGWLIELVSRLGLPPTWWSLVETDGDGGYFTADSLKAIRFARKEDAQAYIDDVGWTECIATEHEWSDPRPAPEHGERTI